MSERQWTGEFPGAIIVCDARGVIVDMNDRAAANHAADGGRALVGGDLRACHPEPARAKLDALFERREPNAYTIRKNGVRKLIYQSPWYRDGQFAGIVELSLPIPDDMPEFIRT